VPALSNDEAYQVSSLPLTLVLDAAGNVLERLDGFKSVESILGVIENHSSVSTTHSNLNNVPTVFISKKKVRELIPTPLPPRKNKVSSIPAVVDASQNIITMLPSIKSISISIF